MAYACFDNNGYTYYKRDGSKLFFSDETHRYLFDYIEKDLSNLPALLMQFISQRINVENMEIVDGAFDDRIIEIIKDTLGEAHPYYKYEWKKTIIKNTGAYFNNVLLHRCHEINSPVSEEWYLERAEHLLAPFLELDDPYPRDYYNVYRRAIGADGYTAGYDDIETLITVPPRMPTGFAEELYTQRIASNILYFILDIAAEGIEKLTTSQRVCLYGNIVYPTFAENALSITKRLGFYPQQGIRDQSTKDIFIPLWSLGGLNIGRDGIPENMSESFAAAVDWAETQTQTTVFEEYEIDDLRQILFLEIMQMVQAGTMVRKCKNCGKYFVVSNRKTAYCDRVDETGRICSAVGPTRNFQKKMEKDEALKIYTRAYRTHFARVRNQKMSQTDFQIWCEEAKKKLEQARAGQLDIDSFQKWTKDKIK